MLDGLDLTQLPTFIAVGFAAQIIDGALGMAFGVISSTLMVSVLGVPPATASAGVHLAECFTTGVSGISHALHKNVNWRLFFRLLVPGIIGGVLGAYLLTSLDASVTRPFVMAYLAGIGLYLLYRGVRFPRDRTPSPRSSSRWASPADFWMPRAGVAGGRSSPRICSSRVLNRAPRSARSIALSSS